MIGGTNIQFAHDPETGRVVVIEINPRTSRSSALASKATGFPIAMVSSLLAGGLTMDEIPYWRDGTLEKYTPSGDYVVVKFARWAFEKFRGAEDRLGTQMRAVGEVMSIGKNYKESLQKAIRSLETGRHGLGFAKDFNARSLDELHGDARRAHQRAAVHHVRGAAQGRRRPRRSTPAPTSSPGSSSRCGSWWSSRRRSSATGRTRAAPPPRTPPPTARALPDELLDAGQEGRLRRRLPGQAARRARGAHPRAAPGAGRRRTATSRCR